MSLLNRALRNPSLDHLKDRIGPNARSQMELVLKALSDMLPEIREPLKIILSKEMGDSSTNFAVTLDGKKRVNVIPNEIDPELLEEEEVLNIMASTGQDQDEETWELGIRIADKRGYTSGISVYTQRMSDRTELGVRMGFDCARGNLEDVDRSVIENGLREIEAELKRFAAEISVITRKNIVFKTLESGR